MSQDDDSTQVPDWEIPANLQPDPEDYGFDLERTLKSVVGLRANVPPDAFTAGTLGTDRVGNGVVIREDGLVLTIGYLITEAETVWLITNDGRAVPGHALAFDQISGFGLVQALGRLNLPAIELGDSDSLKVGAEAVMAAGGGRAHAIEAKVVGRQEFAGYWEYLLDEALFTAPAHPQWGGAALLDAQGNLIGTGSLLVEQEVNGEPRHVNMFVPIDLLNPIFDAMLKTGRSPHPPRPWLGMSTHDPGGKLVVARLSPDGPASRAGVRVGDVVLGVGGSDVQGLAEFFRTVWRLGPAGVEVPLTLSPAAIRFTSRSSRPTGTTFYASRSFTE